jgi:hypothetical protein
MNRIEEPYFNAPKEIILEKNSMSLESTTPMSMSVSVPGIDTKTIIIILLIFFLLITVLGINILTILGNILQNLANFFGPVINQFLNALGYSTGTALDKVSDVTAEVAKGGIDLADGALNNIGALLKGSTPPVQSTLHSGNVQAKKKSISSTIEEPSPDRSENSIQKPITSDKWNWCLVGEYQNKRGCIEITDSDKCLSGQVFPSQKMCLNPTWTP